jgi:hypothetical protein
MAAPASLSPSPVVGLGSHSYGLFEDDFGLNKYTLKAKASTSSGGVFNFKGALNNKFDLAQEVKLQFPYKRFELTGYKRFYLWAGFKRDDAKFHVDFGEFTLGKRFRFYANIKTASQQLRLGAVHEGEKCTAHTSI